MTPWLVFTHLAAVLIGMVLGILGFLFVLRLLAYDGRTPTSEKSADGAPVDL